MISINADCRRSALSLTNIARWSILLILGTGLLAMISCSGRQHATQSSQTKSNAPPKFHPSNPSGAPPASPRAATFKADPNPIQLCDGSGLGVTTLTFTSEGPTAVEVRVGSPNGIGGVLAHAGPNGTAKTGKWVNDGLIFYLQDASEGRTLTPDNTLATVTVKVTNLGCP